MHIADIEKKNQTTKPEVFTTAGLQISHYKYYQSHNVLKYFSDQNIPQS